LNQIIDIQPLYRVRDCNGNPTVAQAEALERGIVVESPTRRRKWSASEASA